jgi:hypothetical protein
VDLCPAGANQGAEIVLFKNKEGRVPKPVKKTAAKKPTAKKSAKADSRSKHKQRGDEEEDDEDEESVAKNQDDEDEDEDVEDEDEDVEKSEDDDADDDADADADADEDEAPARKTAKAKGKKVVKGKTTKAKTAKATSSDDDEDEAIDDEDDNEDIDIDVDESVLKTLPAHVRKTIERSQRVAKQALEIAKEERDRRQTLEYVEKAKKTIPHLTGTADEKGGLLKALYSGEPLTKKIANQVVALLKSGDAAVRSMLMSESGRSRTRAMNGDDSAVSELEEKRTEILKANPKLTKEQAMEKAVAENPELYQRYRVEKRRARGRDADVN